MNASMSQVVKKERQLDAVGQYTFVWLTRQAAHTMSVCNCLSWKCLCMEIKYSSFHCSMTPKSMRKLEDNDEGGQTCFN